ncbi:MAG: glycoside hydrolase family 5 protein [Janthinobacterium lividum]
MFDVRKRLRLLVPLGLITATYPAAQATSPESRTPHILWGINESGLEVGRGDKVGKNFVVPNPSYYLAHRVRLVRLPFRMSRLQPVPHGPLDPTYVEDIRHIVSQDHAAGAITVLDPHGYGFYDSDGKPHDIAADATARANYVDLMSRIAAAFAHEPVAIDLMNEPHTGSDAEYAPVWNEAIAAVRQAGFRGTILVPHCHWSTAADISPQRPFEGRIVDSGHDWVLELHSYLDPDGTGTYRQPVATDKIGASRLAGAIAWSRQTRIRLFLGETGAPPDAISVAGLKAMYQTILLAPDVFWGIAIWGGGPWFKPDYSMRLDPVGGADRPQFQALEEAFRGQT